MAALRSYGRGVLLSGWWRHGVLLGAAFAGYEDADAFDHLGGGAGTLGEEDVGVDSAVVQVHGAGDDHCGETGMEVLGAADQLVAVHLGHHEVAEQEIDAAG